MRHLRILHVELLVCIFVLINSAVSQSQEVYNLLDRIVPNLSSQFDITIDARNVNTLDGNDHVKLVKSEANSIHGMFLHNYFKNYACPSLHHTANFFI